MIMLHLIAGMRVNIGSLMRCVCSRGNENYHFFFFPSFAHILLFLYIVLAVEQPAGGRSNKIRNALFANGMILEKHVLPPKQVFNIVPHISFTIQFCLQGAIGKISFLRQLRQHICSILLNDISKQTGRMQIMQCKLIQTWPMSFSCQVAI